jgi:hypothetical protein
MKTRFILLIAILAVLLTGSIPRAKAGESPEDFPVLTGVMSGGGYRLTTVGLEASAISGGTVSSGGGYRLTRPASPAGGNQCCCNYLPCVFKH